MFKLVIYIYISANCIKLAERLKVRKIIFPGSTNEYLYYGKPLDKDAVPSPSNMYGAIKIAARYVCELLAKRAKFVQFLWHSRYWKFVIYRIFVRGVMEW